MKTNTMTQATELSVRDAVTGKWYVIMPSTYTDSSYMIRVLDTDGTSRTVAYGSFAEMKRRLGAIRNYVAAIRNYVAGN